MNVFAILEPGYIHSPWCEKILNGLSEECLKKNYSISFISFDEYLKNNEKYQIENKSTSVIVIGMTTVMLQRMTKALQKLDAQLLLLNYKPEESFSNAHCLLIDFSSAMFELLSRLRAAGKRRPAMVGVNRESFVETSKKNCFQTVLRKHFHGSPDDENIFYFESSAKNAFESFFEKREDFDNIICANDFIAVYFIKELKIRGISVPEDIYVSSFIDTSIGKIYSSSITSVSIKYGELGKQAIYLCSFLQKSGHFSPLSVYMDCHIDKSDLSNSHFISAAPHAAEAAVNFYNDSDIETMRKVENLLNKCDETDRLILKGLLNKRLYKTIAMDCFISEATVKYRIKTLLKECGLNSRKELVDFLTTYLSGDSFF